MFGKIVISFTIASILLICTIVFGGQVIDDEERMLWFVRKCQKSNAKGYTFFNIPQICDRYENVSCKAFKRLNMTQNSTIVNCEEGLHVDLEYIQTCGVDCDPEEICKEPVSANCENQTISKPPYDETCAEKFYGKADKCNYYYICQVGHPNFEYNEEYEIEDECNGEFKYEKLDDPTIVPEKEKLNKLTPDELDFCENYRKLKPNGTACRYEVCDHSVNCDKLLPGRRYPNPGSCTHYCVCPEVPEDKDKDNAQFFNYWVTEMDTKGKPVRKLITVRLALAKQCPPGEMFDSRQDACVTPEKFGCIGL